MKSALSLSLLAALLVAGCEREERHFEAEIQNQSVNLSSVRESLN